jgi:hypothetical protein
MPLEGFNELVMDVGMCDTCHRHVASGEKVIYHVRLRKIYCSDCSRPHNHEVLVGRALPAASGVARPTRAKPPEVASPSGLRVLLEL